MLHTTWAYLGAGISAGLHSAKGPVDPQNLIVINNELDCYPYPSDLRIELSAKPPTRGRIHSTQNANVKDRYF